MEVFSGLGAGVGVCEREAPAMVADASGRDSVVGSGRSDDGLCEILGCDVAGRRSLGCWAAGDVPGESSWWVAAGGVSET